MSVSEKTGVTRPKIYGISSKANQFIYILVCNYMPNISILAKKVLQIFCSQGCSYTKCLCLKKGNKPKVNQFIYTLVCNYIPNIRILAKTVLQFFVHKVVPIQNACVRKRRVPQPEIYGIGSKANQVSHTLTCNYMPNIRILA